MTQDSVVSQRDDHGIRLTGEDSFLAYGIDSGVANRLVSAGFSPESLAVATSAQLDKAGVAASVQSAVKNRPAIPANTLFRVLQKSRRTCCVCRTGGRSIIVHHIDEWHHSRSHAENNLVVLCLNDHGEAHTIRQLGQNLTPDQIRKHKAEWETEVARVAARSVVGLARVDGANWDYINHTRVFRLAEQLQIRSQLHPSIVPYYGAVRRFNMISEFGALNDPTQWNTPTRPEFYLYGLGEGLQLYFYTSRLLEAVVQKLGVLDISRFDYARSREMISDGTLVFIQSRMSFKRGAKIARGVGQLRTVRGTLSGVQFSATFDAWECTSSSSHSDRLTRMKVASLVGLVSGFELDGGKPSMQLSCLGIGTFFGRNW